MIYLAQQNFEGHCPRMYLWLLAYFADIFIWQTIYMSLCFLISLPLSLFAFSWQSSDKGTNWNPGSSISWSRTAGRAQRLLMWTFCATCTRRSGPCSAKRQGQSQPSLPGRAGGGALLRLFYFGSLRPPFPTLSRSHFQNAGQCFYQIAVRPYFCDNERWFCGAYSGQPFDCWHGRSLASMLSCFWWR